VTCLDARELFSDWTDDALTAEERAQVGAHLAQCADCRKELERFTAAIALLHRMERPRAPVGFVDRVLAAARTVPWYRRLLRRLFLPLSVKLPAEAAALLLVAGLAVYVFQRTPELQQAARQGAFRPAKAPPATFLAPPPAPEAPSARPGASGAKPSTFALEGERKMPPPSNEVRRSYSDRAATVAPPPASSAAGGSSAPSGEPGRGQLGKEQEEQPLRGAGGVQPFSPVPSPSVSPPPPAPSEKRAKTAPAMSAAAPAPAVEPEGEVRNQAKPRSLDAPSAQEGAPAQHRPAPATEGRSDLERDRAELAPAPAAPSGSAMRKLPSADVVGRLAVKDRHAAERALGELLARSGGAVISRREEGGTTVVEVAVPRTAYPEFRQGLARLGVWRSESEPSALPPDVRVTLRLVE
jgi:hypothetical protein